MKVLKTIVCILVSFVLVASPVALPLLVAILTPAQYEHTYLGALDDKYNRLNSIDEPKIVLVGGSSVAFGVDSKALEEYTGMPVVNFGLYAALGTKLMLDLSLSGINKGDVVVISPEMDPQTLSLYFSTQSTFKAIDSDYRMLSSIKASDKFKMLGGVWDFLRDKWDSYLKSDAESSEDSDGIYKSKYFDEYGDFMYPREENVMPGYYDKNTPVNLNSSLFSDDYYDFVDYLNDYITLLRIKGASVYFSYCPINAMSVVNSNKDTVSATDAAMREDINCMFIDTLDQAVMEAGYFYDTNFHLNDAGRTARTIALAKNLRLSHGITKGVVTAVAPKAPALPYDPYYEGIDSNSSYFLYEKRPDGTYAIVGVSESGINEKTLTLPLGYEGLKVTAIAPDAFKGSGVEKLVITNDSNIRTIENGAFGGAYKLKELWIYKTTGDAITPPLNFLGTAKGFAVHVPEGSDYGYHYYWSERGVSFVYDAN